MDELQSNFNSEASETIRSSSNYARNFLEYSCFRTLALYTQVSGHLSDKAFRRLAFDMMLAWEAPSAASQPTLKVKIHFHLSYSCVIDYGWTSGSFLVVNSLSWLYHRWLRELLDLKPFLG